MEYFSVTSVLFEWTRSALEQKKTEESKEFGPIDYDAPVKSDQKTIGLGTKVHLHNILKVYIFLFFLKPVETYIMWWKNLFPCHDRLELE